MNFNAIHHIAIICSDYDAAKDFYVTKLGFPVIRENYRPERDDWKIDLRINETTELELFIMKKFFRILRFFIIFAIVLVIAVVLSNTIYSIVLK